ncbi:FAD-dependent monooxygenase [Marivirga sp. S37H4]|uniref:FAD-dependent monooxygenase n=1 Tax=Marivirga aurantiaca TaxID=2802615 RepID=A0A934WY28_9BACT|nr:FAD-dependent monooxygenase [Marivirga aurantiaca]MBK6265114.1 FAD-dependent monooxygenase [Marivirga aurantiaca]
MKVEIIGAGIAGLTAAIALEKRGFQPKIYEQAKNLKAVGAGIILASNAMQVYKRLGLDEQLKSQGIPLNALNITNQKLQLISKVDLNYFKNKYNLQSLAIHRGKLQQVLLDNLKHTEICLDHQLKNITQQNEAYQLDFENGKSVNSTLLIGADGIHSKVRANLFPTGKIRSMRQICWRGVTQFELPSIYKNELNEAWGRGDRFAFVQFSHDQIYWYAVKSFKQSEKEFSEDHLSSYFQKYPPIVQEIIKATPAHTLHTTIMQDLKPISNWHDEFSCLIGDAAHATTPNMGQGACQSIEDAYILADCLSKQNVLDAFKTYQKIRMPKAHQVVKQSWQIGKISHWENPVAIAIRNKLLKLIPQKLNQVQLEKLFQLEKIIG